jgi:hypothetical protein
MYEYTDTNFSDFLAGYLQGAGRSCGTLALGYAGVALAQQLVQTAGSQ